MHRSGHLDTFARDRLPAAELWPELLLDRPEFRYPERLNCVSVLLDRRIAEGDGDRPCLISLTETWTYRELAERVDRIANVLTGPLGMVPGNRVLLRSANTPMFVAAYLAVMKAGGVAVATMPLLRAKELALPDPRRRDTASRSATRAWRRSWSKARASAPALERIVTFGGERERRPWKR